MATPPARTQSLLSQALGKRPAAAPAGARPSASGGPMVDGVRQKQQKASGAGLLGEAQRLSFKGGYTPRNSLGAANTSPTPHPAAVPSDSVIPCGDARRGGRWRDNCQLACCSTAATIRRNAHGSPANSDDTEEDEEDDHGAAEAHAAEVRRATPPCGASGGPRPSGGWAMPATSRAAPGAAMAAMTAAGAAVGARATGAGAASAAATAAAAGAAPAPSAAAASAAGAHRFVWAEDLTRALEAQAVPLGLRSREELARLASENYQVSSRSSNTT